MHIYYRRLEELFRFCSILDLQITGMQTVHVRKTFPIWQCLMRQDY